METIIMLVLMIAIFYFLLIRPQQKRQKKITEFRNSLDKGSKVVTAGGVFGTIKELKQSTFMIEVAPGVKIEVDKNSVYPSPEDANIQQQEASKN